MSNKNMWERINQISKETGVSAKKVADLLFALRDGNAIGNNDLVQRMGVSRNALNLVKEMLASILGPVSKSTQLDTGRVQEIQEIFDEDYKPEEAIWLILEDENYKQAVELLKTFTDKRPSPERRYDQFTATIETTARRASLFQFFGDIQDKRLLFIGDDDFTSVAVADIGGAKDVTVVDIDERILNEIETISGNTNLGIKAVHYDARKKLPTELRKMFDVVFTDPPYTTEGIELFTSRA